MFKRLVQVLKDKFKRLLDLLSDPGDAASQVVPSIETFFARHSLYPRENDSMGYFKFRRFLVLLLYLSMGTMWLLYIGDVHTRNANANYMNEMVLGFECYVQCFGIFCFAFCQDLSTKFMDSVKRYRAQDKTGIYEEVHRSLVLKSRLLYYNTMVGLLILHAPVIILEHQCIEYNKSHNITDLCGVIGPISYFHLEVFPRKQLYFAAEILILMYAVPAITQLPLSASSAYMYVIVMVRKLKTMLSAIGKTGKCTKNEISEIVKYHMEIMRVLDKVNKIASVPHCLHLFVSSSVCTLITYQLMNLTWEYPFGHFLHLVVWMLVSLINCISGQTIAEVSLTISDEIFHEVVWYELDISTQKDLLLIMTYSQSHPMVAKTGPFGGLSLRQWLLIVKGVYTFFIGSLARKMQEKINVH